MLDRDDVGEQRFEVSNSQVICAVPRGWVATHAHLIESAHGVGTWSRAGPPSTGTRMLSRYSPCQRRLGGMGHAMT